MTSLRDRRPLLKPIQYSLWRQLRTLGPQNLTQLSEGRRLNQAFTRLVLDELRAMGLVTSDDDETWRVVRVTGK